MVHKQLATCAFILDVLTIMNKLCHTKVCNVSFFVEGSRSQIVHLRGFVYKRSFVVCKAIQRCLVSEDTKCIPRSLAPDPLLH